jgi:hypothetical protein
MVPRGFTVTGLTMVSSAQGTNAAISVGDAGAAARYMAITAVATVTTSAALAAAGLLYQAPADTVINITVTTLSAAAVAGTIDLYLTGFMA